MNHVLEGGLLPGAVLALLVKGSLLGQNAHGLALGQEHFALGGLVFPREQLEKGGFTAPVDTDDTQLVPLVHRERYLLQHRGGAEAQGQVGC